MIKIDTEACIFIIGRNDLTAGIRPLRKRSGIPVRSNSIVGNPVKNVFHLANIKKSTSLS